MKTHHKILIGMFASGLCLTQAQADDRRFTYTYEPETTLQGALEFEQWITLRTQRTTAGDVKQENYNQWELREELEYGVTDRYSVSLYLNFQSRSYRDVSTSPPTDFSEFQFKGVSMENRYMLINPANHAVGLTLYLEPSFSGDEAEVEEKIILGQRHGDWKWALNLTHATEWSDNFHATEGELEASFGIALDLNQQWSIGLELRDHNELPEYSRWENTALFLGPVVSYRQEKWWAALTIMPQIYGANYLGNPDRNTHLDLDGHERVNIRFLMGFSF